MGPSDIDSQSESMKFAALLVHDLETPLAVAKNFMKRLEKDRFDPENSRHLELYKSTRLALDRAERILEDFIDQVRNETRVLQIKKEPVDLIALIKECVEVINPLLEDKDIRVSFVTSESSPGKMDIDRSLTARVLDNYLVNAVRHAPLDSVINISVSGTGKGVRVEIANKTDEVQDFDLNEIFDVQRQVQLREERKVRGSGLGLIFSKMVIESHGGKTGALRNTNGETVFWFEF